MDYQNIFERYEIKFLLTTQQQRELYHVMQQYMKPDTFGKSTIYNIYYDTLDKRLIRRSIENPCYKEKLRVRSYGIVNEEQTVFVELKKKYQGVVYKRRIDMSKCMAENYLNHHIRLSVQSQIMKEVDYFLCFYESLEPSAFISYNREAFLGIEDQNFRMTFDNQILMRAYDMDLKSGAYGTSLLSENQVLLEIKTVMGIPEWLRNFLSMNQIYKTSYSKYGCAFQKMLLPQMLGASKAGKYKGSKNVKERNGGTEDVA